MKNSEKSAFCVCCGNPTCSEKCHFENFEKTKICTFSKNFDKSQKTKSLRSLTFENIKIAEKLNLATGSFLQKTSKSFIYGMKHYKQDFIFLQRGFRQYGNPLTNEEFERIYLKKKKEYLKNTEYYTQIENTENSEKNENKQNTENQNKQENLKNLNKKENLENLKTKNPEKSSKKVENLKNPESSNFLENLKILKKNKIDYFFNHRRVCNCSCIGCASRQSHPALTCYKECENTNQIYLQDFLENKKFDDVCECGCEFCKSGAVNLAHKEVDCILYCDEKDFEEILAGEDEND